MRSGVCAFCARMASATSFALRAESATVLEPAEVGERVSEPSLLQLERTSAVAATTVRAANSRDLFLGIGESSQTGETVESPSAGSLRAPPESFAGKEPRGSAQYTTLGLRTQRLRTIRIPITAPT